MKAIDYIKTLPPQTNIEVNKNGKKIYIKTGKSISKTKLMSIYQDEIISVFIKEEYVEMHL